VKNKESDNRRPPRVLHLYMDNVGGINFSFPNPFQKRFDIKYAILKGIAGNDNWTGNFIQGG